MPIGKRFPAMRGVVMLSAPPHPIPQREPGDAGQQERGDNQSPRSERRRLCRRTRARPDLAGEVASRHWIGAGASLLMQAGKEVHFVSAQLGHADAAFTFRTYGHLIPRDRRGEVSFLDEISAGSPAPICTRQRPRFVANRASK
jgi:hypothetical protein